MMFGWLSWAAARASRRKRCLRSWSDPRLAEIVLTATSRPRTGSKAFHTSPMAPRPILPTILYFPSCSTAMLLPGKEPRISRPLRGRNRGQPEHVAEEGKRQGVNARGPALPGASDVQDRDFLSNQPVADRPRIGCRGEVDHQGPSAEPKGDLGRERRPAGGLSCREDQSR